MTEHLKGNCKGNESMLEVKYFKHSLVLESSLVVMVLTSAPLVLSYTLYFLLSDKINGNGFLFLDCIVPSDWNILFKPEILTLLT